MQEVTRLLSNVSDLKQQLLEAQSAAAPAAGAVQQSVPLSPRLHLGSISPQTLGSPLTSSPSSSRQVSSKPSLTQLAGSPVTRSPTLSRAASFQNNQLVGVAVGGTTGDQAGVAVAGLNVSPFSSTAAAAEGDKSGSTTPAAVRSRSFHEGMLLEHNSAGPAVACEWKTARHLFSVFALGNNLYCCRRHKRVCTQTYTSYMTNIPTFVSAFTCAMCMFFQPPVECASPWDVCALPPLNQHAWQGRKYSLLISCYG